MLKCFIDKLYGNAVVFANLPGQRRVPYIPQEKLHALRDAGLRKIVRYAAKTVPYYRRLFQRNKYSRYVEATANLIKT
jgi:phenylacetate-coenzyme A ligase PaaK-like adenylate-forming protein